MTPPKTIQIIIRQIHNGWLQTVVVSTDLVSETSGEIYFESSEECLNHAPVMVEGCEIEIAKKRGIR